MTSTKSVELRPTIAADLPHVIGEPLPHRIRATTAMVDGKVIGVGGIGYRPDGTVVAFVARAPGVAGYPVALHRAARMTLRAARASGIPTILAEADPTVEAAERWLVRLGFVHVGTSVNNKALYAWHRGAPLNVE